MSIQSTETLPDVRLIYLLGAGASSPALPLASTIPRRMHEWAVKLTKEAIPIFQDSPAQDTIRDMASELKRWGDEASKHFSIDTLAKKLYLLSQSSELWQLKAAMSALFMLEQSLSRTLQRHDSFLASVLEHPERPPMLPATIGILTWNYDRLFERAYHQYCYSVDMVQANVTFSPQVIRLNGLLGRAINKGTGDEYNLNFENGEREVYERISHEFEELQAHEPVMRFAFEQNNLPEFDRVKSLAAKADTLVVIGYSFPFFNRKYDRMVLKTMLALERVFLQVLPRDAKAIKTRMQSLRDLPEIQFVDDQKQFFIPHDF